MLTIRRITGVAATGIAVAGITRPARARRSCPSSERRAYRHALIRSPLMILAAVTLVAVTSVANAANGAARAVLTSEEGRSGQEADRRADRRADERAENRANETVRTRPRPISLQSDVSPDPVLSIHPPAPGSRMRTTLRGWRHDYDIVLSAKGALRVVHDEHGRRHDFLPIAPTERGAVTTRPAPVRYRAARPSSGELHGHVDRDGNADGRYVWRRHDGVRVTFAGSVPVRLDGPGGERHELHYRGGRLQRVVRPGRPALTFAYASDALRRVTLSDGRRWRLSHDDSGGLRARRDDPAGECGADDDAAREPVPGAGCDRLATPPDEHFRDAAHIPGAVRIDARPASCRSYFAEYVGTERGAAIETGLATLPHYADHEHAVRSFPVADFIGEELRVVRSRDLSLPAHNAPANALLARLLADGETIVRRLLEPLARDGELRLTERDRTTVLTHRPERPVVLELVVRHGLASDAQIRQIERARTLLHARHGIVLRVIEIP